MSRVGHCADPCRDRLLRTCFVRTELLQMDKTSQPRNGTPSHVLCAVATISQSLMVDQIRTMSSNGQQPF